MINAIEAPGYTGPTADLVALADPAHQDFLGQPVPEPATIAIWGLGIGLAGAAALRRKQPRGRWSQENRQAIYAIIGGKR
jgi:hypothetical protein